MYFEIDSEFRDNPEVNMWKSECHRFAKEVLRPASFELDRMDAKDTSKKGNVYWEVMRKAKKNGYHRLLIPDEYGGTMVGPLEFNIWCEEMGWGSVGLATNIAEGMFPAAAASLIGTPKMIDEVVRPWMEDEGDKYDGCWSVMDPDRGSDWIMVMDDPDPESWGIEGFCMADKDGNEWVINGTKSYWTGSAPTATWVLTHPNIPPHRSPHDVGAAVFPLNLPGVTQSPPIDKVGMRDHPQGELIFDNVRIPNHYMIAQAADFGVLLAKVIICCTSCHMGGAFIGLARAAFEEALKYCKERVQGKKPIIEHQLTRYRLYNMFEKIETARAYLRAVTKNVFEEVFQNHTLNPSAAHALSAQVYCKNMAFEVCHDALQLHGGAGILKEMPIEKFFRDSRPGLIMDGTSEILSLEVVADMLEEELYTTD
ncbi:MAG TPA: acyl-CoA dehydrogenase family protein [Candidatus Anoxymicrobiaceae bacterium]